MSVYANQGNLQNYKRRSEVLKTTSTETFLNLLLVGCLVACIAIELIRMLVDGVKMIKMMFDKLKNKNNNKDIKNSEFRSFKPKRNNESQRN